jgi:hypothetical protein
VPALGDGVNYNIAAPGAGRSDGPGYGATDGNALDTTANGIAAEFPFLPTPHDGRNRRHIDCGEPGAQPCDGPPSGASAPTAPTIPGNRVGVRTNP